MEWTEEQLRLVTSDTHGSTKLYEYLLLSTVKLPLLPRRQYFLSRVQVTKKMDSHGSSIVSKFKKKET